MSRASSWVIGAFLGNAAGCAWYLAHVMWGWPWGWQIYVSVALMVLAITPATEYGLSLLVSIRAGWLHPEQAFVGAVLGADDDQPGDDGAPGPGEVRGSPLVGGYELDEAERHHFEGLLRTFQHAAAAGSLTSGALIPAAFDNWGHWGYWTDQAAKSGFCIKVNGLPTTLPDGRTYAWVVGEIRKGNIIWPSGDGPAPQPLPHPFRAGLVYKVEAKKAGKGGPKVGEHDDN